MPNPTSNTALRRKFKNQVSGGRDIYNMLCVTATGTGLGTTSYRLGQCVLDSSAGKWFLCTATAGSGTWVQIMA